MWDSSSKFFVYTTLNHVKYCLTSGDTGTLRTLEMPVYATQVTKGKLHCLDRECKTRFLSIDMTEANFKLALESKNYADVMHIIRHAKLCGEALVSYLQDRGYPEVALHFVKDLTTRFKLALACGNIQVALSTAYELGDDVSWHHLGVEALRQGNYQVVEMAYQRTKNFERLTFLYLMTGNTEKLRKMLKIAEMRHDLMARFHNALFLGNAEERIRVLEDAGQLALAYLTSATHGLTEDAERILERIGKSSTSIPRSLELQHFNVGGATLLQPPTPIMRAEIWPLLAVSHMSMYDMLDSHSRYAPDGDDEATGETWEPQLGAEEMPLPGDQTMSEVTSGWDEELELGDELMSIPAEMEGNSIATRINNSDETQAPFRAPLVGVAPMVVWCETSGHAAYHAAAGSFETGMHLLYRQIAVVEFRPLKLGFMARASSFASHIPGMPLASAVVMPIVCPAPAEVKASLLPALPLNMAHLIELLKHAYKEFQRGNFTSSERAFRAILQSLPLYVAATRAETQEV